MFHTQTQYGRLMDQWDAYVHAAMHVHVCLYAACCSNEVRLSSLVLQPHMGLNTSL